MTVEMSPDFDCGKILYCLKMSRLNYLVKETPYSAYITVRKKFIKENIENQITPAALNSSDNKKELLTLNELNKDLEKRLAMAKIEFEEMELAKENQIADISKRDDEIENLLKAERILKKTN